MDTTESLQQRLIERSEEDGEFRSQLLADPRVAIREALDIEFPEDFNVVIHEDGPRTAHLVLPPSAQMTDTQLEQATGGGDQYCDWDFAL